MSTTEVSEACVEPGGGGVLESSREGKKFSTFEPGNAPHWRGGGKLAQGDQVPPWPPGAGLSLRLLVTQPSAMWNRYMVSA